MNKGIKIAIGEWLVFMNAGDVFVDNNVMSKAEPFLHEEQLQILYGNIIRVFDKHKERKYPIRKTNIDAVDFLIGNIDHQASFIRRSLFDKYGLYDTTYKLAADHYFFFKVAGINHEKTKYVNLDIAYFMMDGSSTKSKDKYKEEKESMYRKEFTYLYDNMKELSEYRASSILIFLLKIRMAIKRTGFNTIVRKILNFRFK